MLKYWGVLEINREGHHALPSNNETIAEITYNVRVAGIQLHTIKEQNGTVFLEEHPQRIRNFLEKHWLVFSGIDTSVPPVVAPYRPIPLAFREKSSAYQQEL